MSIDTIELGNINLTKFLLNGNREEVTFNTKITDEIKNGVLTLLKNDTNTSTNSIYSLSIKVDDNSELSTLNANLNFKNKKIYSSTNNNFSEVSEVSDVSEVSKDYKVSHILLIGKLTADNTLTITKSFLITTHNIEQNIISDENFLKELKKEEYLNLYYIDYFSFIFDSFENKYNKLLSSEAAAPTTPVAEAAAPTTPVAEEEAPTTPVAEEEAEEAAEEAARKAEEAARKAAEEASAPTTQVVEKSGVGLGASSGGGKKKVKKTKKLKKV